MNYLLSASLAMALFYGVYALMLRRLTFHGLNRAYLLGSLVLSMALPLVDVPLPAAAEPAVRRAVSAPPKPVPLPADGRLSAPVRASPSPTGPDWPLLGWSLYAAGAAFVAFRLARRLNLIRQLARQDGEEIADLLVVPTEGGSASFFRLVLLNDAGLTPAERALVLAHEAEHARLWHSFDRLAVAVLAVAFWFNPVLWLYQRSLAHLHELQVDAALARRHDRRAYAQLLLKMAQPGFALANTFARQPLRDRLRFLFQTKTSSNVKKSRYLLLLPVATLVVWACQRDVLRTDEPTVPTGKVWVIEHPERFLSPVTVILKVPAERGSFVKERGQMKPMKFASMIQGIEPRNIRRIIVENTPGLIVENEGKTVARITVEAIDTTYRYNASQNSLNRLITDWAAANATNFLTRITLKNDEWTTPYAFANSNYDCLIFKLPSLKNGEGHRGYRQLNVAKGKSPVFKLDDREISEEEVNCLSREDVAKIQSIGVDEGHVAALEYGERGINGKVFFSTQLFGGVKTKRLPQPAKP